MSIPHVLLLLLMQHPLPLPPLLGSSSCPPPLALPASPSLQRKPQTDCRLLRWGGDVRNNDPWVGVARIRMRTVYRGEQIKGGGKGMNAKRG
ncbi:hypothetical protein BDP81DRAFT_181139 [Colletotrichum phormii]|uniref:Secreted protein n=1 Tax=Colletotrichum phormii TaxID=359342 RepID=A0AAJ0EK77_9PEZI|nr:uncharacterized protein BDP81DRAFT_181139 [Colletotrichum phormii]KAK1639655.1 hypothetical protein BDP81DRAFT_181139 [Colletotrichum phormii]